MTTDFFSHSDGPDGKLLLALALDAAGPAMGRRICQWVVRACRDWYRGESDVLPRPSSIATDAAEKVIDQVTRRSMVPRGMTIVARRQGVCVDRCDAGYVLECYGDRFWFTGPIGPDEPFLDHADSLAPLYIERPLVAAARSPHWRAIERQHLASHPTCLACGGRAFLQAHHKVPFHLDRAGELDPRNLRTLCMAPARCCHLRIGHSLDFRAFNPHCDRDAQLSLTRITHRKYELPA